MDNKEDSFDEFFEGKAGDMFLFTIYNNGMVYTFEVSLELLREISGITHMLHESMNKEFEFEFNDMVQRYMDRIPEHYDEDYVSENIQDKKKQLLNNYIEKAKELKEIKETLIKLESSPSTATTSADFSEFVNFIKSKLADANEDSKTAKNAFEMPSISSGSFEFFDSIPPEIADKIRERENDIEFKQKKITESVKRDYVKFLYNDEETINNEISKLKNKISDLIDKDKYEAVDILKERVSFLEKKLGKNDKSKKDK